MSAHAHLAKIPANHAIKHFVSNANLIFHYLMESAFKVVLLDIIIQLELIQSVKLVLFKIVRHAVYLFALFAKLLIN
jgi:hypothetical protein